MMAAVQTGDDAVSAKIDDFLSRDDYHEKADTLAAELQSQVKQNVIDIEKKLANETDEEQLAKLGNQLKLAQSLLKHKPDER
uniref:Lipoprotein n=1 Tax=Panagrellus redivivus TaxID=6233 RepID=A0A7E4VH94_PANRE